MDAIFAQPTIPAVFNGPVDIRFNPAVTVQAPSLLDVTSAAELSALFALGPASPQTVNMYFIDSLEYCDGANPSAVGCADFIGFDMVVESAAAAGPNGAELGAHELAHNLGLVHDTSPALNLMDAVLNGNTDISLSQSQEMHDNFGTATPLQFDVSAVGFFVEITPVLISGDGAVPEPSSWMLIVLAIAILAWGKKRRCWC